MDKIEVLLRDRMLNNTSKRRKVFPTAGGRRRTRKHLAEFCGEIGFNVGAEIGVRLGRFSKVLCDFNKELTLWCIDPWRAYHRKYDDKKQEMIFQEFLRNVEGYDKIKVLRKTSMDALDSFKDRSLDFVFIDGDHTFDFVMLDIIYWSKKVKHNGLIMCHDFYPFEDNGVWNAVKAYTSSHNLRCYVTKELEPTAYWVNP